MNSNSTIHPAVPEPAAVRLVYDRLVTILREMEETVTGIPAEPAGCSLRLRAGYSVLEYLRRSFVERLAGSGCEPTGFTPASFLLTEAELNSLPPLWRALAFHLAANCTRCLLRRIASANETQLAARAVAEQQLQCYDSIFRVLSEQVGVVQVEQALQAYRRPARSLYGSLPQRSPYFAKQPFLGC